MFLYLSILYMYLMYIISALYHIHSELLDTALFES